MFLEVALVVSLLLVTFVSVYYFSLVIFGMVRELFSEKILSLIVQYFNPMVFLELALVVSLLLVTFVSV